MDATFELDAVAYRALAREVKLHLGLDLESYKPQQVWRRVTSFAQRHGLDDARALTTRLGADQALQDGLRNLLTINVSEFFRDGDAWDLLRRSYLEPMLRAGRPVRAWSAGCSFGYEPYSLAMLATEIVPSPTMRILATDIDEMALARTKAAIFAEADVARLEPSRRQRHFVPSGTGWTVRPEVRRLVDVRRHDLTADPVPGLFDLIVCRNVLIYLTEAAKSRLYPAFAAALRPGGVLFVGGTEIVPHPTTHGLRIAGRCLYTRD